MLINFSSRLFAVSVLVLPLCLILAPKAALAQRSETKTPQALPTDITPRVIDGQCGGFGDQLGPFDYRNAHPLDKRLVERHHFDMEYSIFQKGQLSGKTSVGTANVAGGFQYVLKSFPNHPLALDAMERLGKRLGSERPQNADYPLECWYVRAFKIAPDDAVVRALYGIYLANRGRREEALHNLAIADKELQGNGNMQYNIGLIHFRLQKYELAQLNALRATRSGFQLDGLERMLKKAGRWNPQLQLPPAETPGSSIQIPATEPDKTSQQ